MDTIADIKNIKLEHKGWRITVTMNNGNTYYTQHGICRGIEAHSIYKTVPNLRSLHSVVNGCMHLQPLIQKCVASKTKANKNALAHEILNIYNQYLPDVQDADTTFPQASNKEYWDKVTEAEKNGAHIFEGIKTIGFGNKTYSVEQMKKDGIL